MKSKKPNLQAPQWDLSEIYKSVNDPKINADLAKLKTGAQQFEKKYKNKIGKMNLARLLTVFKEYEALNRIMYLLMVYPDFSFTINTKDPKITALMQRVESELTAIQNNFIFFGLELARHPKLPKFIDDPKAAPYRFMLQKMLVNKKHQLKTDQEKILNLKSITSHSAWVKLYAKTEALIEVEYQGKKMGLEEALNFSHSAKRSVRKDVFKVTTAELKKYNDQLTYIYSQLLLDKHQDDQLRKYDSPEQWRHEHNGISEKAVTQLIDGAKKHSKLISKFYGLRQKLTGLKETYTYDRYADINFGVPKKIYTFPQASNTVRKAFSAFDPYFAEVFDKLVQSKHIDAKMSPQKRNGAYCAEMPRGYLPYIMMNFNGEDRSVQTLAHEAGHAIQDTLTEKHPITVAHPALTIAETSSVFCEMVVFENLLAEAKTDKQKARLYVTKIDDVLATIFRQISYLGFERRAHGLMRQKGAVSAAELNQAWIESQKEVYGNAITYPEGYEYWWAYILHFYEYPFYVYAYAFGNLLVFALWQQYKNAQKTDQAQKFVAKYKRLLATGGTLSTMETMRKFGFDPEDPEFWDQGFNALRDLIAALAKLC